jgi:hypothetical protein
MALERRRIKSRRVTNRAEINWRLTPERVLVRLGLADPTDRNASEVAVDRHLMRLALAAKQAREVPRGDSWWKLARKWTRKRAFDRLNRAMELAVEYGGLGTDPARQKMLIQRLGVLYNGPSLLDLTPAAPWACQVSNGDLDQTPDPGRQQTADSRSAAKHQTRDSSGEPGPQQSAQTPDRPRSGTDAQTDSGPASPTPWRTGRRPVTRELEPVSIPAGETADPSADSSVEVSAAAVSTGPSDNTVKAAELSTKFLEVLAEHNGEVAKARTAMAEAGQQPPSRAYAYELRQIWKQRQKQPSAADRLAPVG